jgi:DNA-binding protein HU-beta
MNKSDLIHKIKPIGISIVATESILEALGTAIQQALINGDEVTLPGVGKFSVKHRAARKGRNPRTGETIIIPERMMPKFSAAKALKEALD